MSVFRNLKFFAVFGRAPDEVLENSLYLGGARAAFDSNIMTSLGITHILSVCPEFSWEAPSTAFVHHAIPVDDAVHENLLIRLPEACGFIQRGIDEGGKVYVHCMMGISRSVTVVCAYLMKTRALSAADALVYVQSKRPVAEPNRGFREQLEVWSACDYAPSVLNPVYLAWTRKHREEHGILSSNSNFEAIQIVDRLYIIEDLPQTADPLAAFLRRTSVTHLLTLKPFQSISLSESTPSMERCHFHLEDGIPEDLVLKLPEAVEFIQHGMESPEAVILVHSFDLTIICVVACAYLMKERSVDGSDALQLLQLALPLFNATTDFTSLISLYEACQCTPTPEHPEIQKFRAIRREEESKKLHALRENRDNLL